MSPRTRNGENAREIRGLQGESGRLLDPKARACVGFVGPESKGPEINEWESKRPPE